ncbi:PAS domain-containing protein [Dyadobacter flavalbus]|uniref:histidine kinase n=1 Tax=Dyadobacter flavalbus TaxID=2579942 RepID=A0A5M8QCM4_9BACT|nr:PAS domain-containing protein [Dyadobacter flavalbus]KAA6432783.1 PAS domain-containing protein [Dyadobacter flavalbus]
MNASYQTLQNRIVELENELAGMRAAMLNTENHAQDHRTTGLGNEFQAASAYEKNCWNETQARIRESEERFKVIANIAPVLIWLSSPDKQCYFFNKGWLDFTGRTMEQENGFGWAEGVHEEDFERCLQIYNTNFDARQEFSMNYRLRRFDGEYRWISDRGVPQYTESGVFLGYVGGGMDIHDQINFAESLEKEVQNRTLQLKKSEEFLQSILNTTSNSIASYEAVYDDAGEIYDFRILYSNEETYSQHATRFESIIGRMCSEVYPEIFEKGVFEKLVKCINTGKPDAYVTDYQNSNGTFWFDASIESHGNRVTVTARNITEELEADLQLKELNQKLKIQNSIFNHSEENANFGSFALTLATNKLECSDNLYRLVGHLPQEFTPSFEQFISFLHPGDRQRAIRDGMRALETRNLVQNDYRVITKDGSLKYLRLSGKFIKEGGKQIMIGAMQDVTKDIQLNEALRLKNIELKRNNEELASFSYVASHDLQEPLRKIRAFSSRILEREQHFSDITKDYFNRIVSAATRMQKLIEALLSYSNTGSSEASFVPADLNKILEDVKTDLEDLIEDKNVRIEASELPVLPVIPLQFQQLLQNLIGNSIKYSKPQEPPVIEIHAELTHEQEKNGLYWKISVSDNGIGFDQRYENRIFDLFQRLHGKSEFEGTGIGLAICKKIAQNHHGFMSAKGVIGKGSTFSVYLPAETGK